MKALVQTAKALSDTNRIRILAALGCGEVCVCQLVELLKLAHSTVSKHLSILSQAGLVECRKSGRWIHYRLPKANRASLAARMTDLVLRELTEDDAAIQDQKNLKRILRMDTEKLCSLQKQKRAS